MQTQTQEHEPERRLVPFLRQLADELEHNSLLPCQTQRISEFYMAYQFQEQAIRDGDQSGQDSDSESINEADMLKFMSLGWYVYKMLQQGESIDSILEDNDLVDVENMVEHNEPN